MKTGEEWQLLYKERVWISHNNGGGGEKKGKIKKKKKTGGPLDLNRGESPGGIESKNKARGKKKQTPFRRRESWKS